MKVNEIGTDDWSDDICEEKLLVINGLSRDRV